MWEARDKGNEVNVIKMKSSAIICHCKSTTVGGESEKKTTSGRRDWGATARDTSRSSGTSRDETDSSDDVIKMSADRKSAQKKHKKKMPGRRDGR